LLADHLVDVLLDVATCGVNRVEREGIAHVHESRFVLIGSMNPEEGELRPQFLDRFGLSVDVAADTDPGRRAEAVGRRLAFDAEPAGLAQRWAGDQDDLRSGIAAARPVVVTSELTLTVSRLCTDVGAESLRADLVICRAAAALAGLEGRDDVTVEDVRRVAPLALGHRRRRQPFEQPGIDSDDVDRSLDGTDSDPGPDPDPDPDPDPGPDTGSGSGEAAGDSEADQRPDEQEADHGAAASPRPRIAAADAPTRVVRLEASSAAAGSDGRRSTVLGTRGRLVGDRQPDGPVGSVAVAATVRAAATRQGGVGTISSPFVEPGDLREAVRERRAGNLVVLVVDASGSMGASRRMEAAKGAVMSLLLDAYQRRDRVAMVTFRGDEAEVALRPTASVEVARARLAETPTGGRTPLAAGIDAALELATSTGRHDDAERPLLVVVTDGRATAGPPSTDPVQASQDAAATVRRRGVAAVVVDVEAGPTRLGLAAELAQAMGARHLTLGELSAGALTLAVRTAID
ncbi:MAG: VWA domain-containing protein, partial [Actinomycetota bacterium]|nr:VWA domain-containing protein [Actinomycetota bacterium]